MYFDSSVGLLIFLSSEISLSQLTPWLPEQLIMPLSLLGPFRKLEEKRQINLISFSLKQQLFISCFLLMQGYVL